MSSTPVRFWQGLARYARAPRLPLAVLAVVLAALGTAVPAPPALAQALLSAAGEDAGAASGAAATPAPSPEPRGPADEFERGTPRSSMRAFLQAAREGDYERASKYLDLRPMPPARRAQRGPELARDLHVVLDRKLWVELGEISADPAGAAEPDLARDQELVGTIETGAEPIDVVMQRVSREDGVPIWKISSRTLKLVPDLYDEYGYGRLGEVLPRIFFEVRFLEIQLWQWVGLAVLIVGSALLAWLLTIAIVRIATPILRRSASAVDEQMVRRVLTPFWLGATVLLFSGAKGALGLALPVENVIAAIDTALLIIAYTWVVLRVVDAIGERIAGRLAARGQFGVLPLIRPARRGLKLLVILFAIIVSLDNFGFNVTALIAGLGVGGIAVALAAQKSLENLFGAITLFSDQPVRVGDFCRFGDRVGTVEEIGLRSTRVRTLDRTLVAIPNAEFAGMQLENFTAREKIWYHPTLGLRYETTPDQIRYVLVEVRRMLYAHPRVDPDPARIRFVGFGTFSLDFEIFAYVTTRDFGEFLEIAEDLNLRIMDIVARAGTGFAFPSQTTYLEAGEGVDKERTRAAEREVEDWRQRGTLNLPNFPRDEIQQLGGTLDYPPKGSPMARQQELDEMRRS